VDTWLRDLDKNTVVNRTLTSSQTQEALVWKQPHGS
jgi:hypothetical protein